jgi:hypothetical protein
MKVLVRLVVLIFAFAIPLPACHSDGGSASNTSRKGGGKMKTYYMGRFAIDVPVEMKQAVQAHVFRLVDIEEGCWGAGDDVPHKRSEKWLEHLRKIESLDKPRGVKKIIIKEEELQGYGSWSKGVLYYGDYMSKEEGTWDIFVDYGRTFAWFKLEGILQKEDLIFSWLKEVVHSYHPVYNSESQSSAFYTRFGFINLPYKRQEKTYSRFEGTSPDMKLEVDMNETHEVERLSLVQRLAASLITRFAPGVDVKKIRARKRVAAGHQGEELIMRMSADGEDTQIQFGWEYRGQEESGEHPEIQITMETPDGNLEEKLKVWDAILDSFKPMYR